MRKNVAILALFILAVAPRASAQVNAGEAKLNLNGNLSVGYSDDTTNTAGSDHSIFGAGAADLSGSYYNPNFLSFDVQPFYNQSRLNSTSQSLTASQRRERQRQDLRRQPLSRLDQLFERLQQQREL